MKNNRTSFSKGRSTAHPPRHAAQAASRSGEGKPAQPSKAYGKSASWKEREKPAFGKSRSDKPRFDKPQGAKPQGKFHKARPEPAKPHVPRDGVMLWGMHAVREAWLNPQRRCFRLWATEAALENFTPTLEEAKDALLKRPDVKKTDRMELDRLLPPGSVHQGIVLEVSVLPEPSLSDITTMDPPPDLLLMLDQVTDPHNVGAILRSAAAFGARAVIMTERNAPNTTGVLAKTASGAAEHVPQIHVVNLARALDELKQAGYWCVGLAEEGESELAAQDLSGRTVLVLGAEGEGLRQLTRKKCDALARLPTGGPIGSLNVSNAAAVALYEVRRQKGA